MHNIWPQSGNEQCWDWFTELAWKQWHSAGGTINGSAADPWNTDLKGNHACPSCSKIGLDWATLPNRRIIVEPMRGVATAVDWGCDQAPAPTHLDATSTTCHCDRRSFTWCLKLDLWPRILTLGRIEALKQEIQNDELIARVFGSLFDSKRFQDAASCRAPRVKTSRSPYSHTIRLRNQRLSLQPVLRQKDLHTQFHTWVRWIRASQPRIGHWLRIK